MASSSFSNPGTSWRAKLCKACASALGAVKKYASIRRNKSHGEGLPLTEKTMVEDDEIIRYYSRSSQTEPGNDADGEIFRTSNDDIYGYSRLSKLCPHCRRLLDEGEWNGSRRILWESYHELETSAQDGCALCVLQLNLYGLGESDREAARQNSEAHFPVVLRRDRDLRTYYVIFEFPLGKQLPQLWKSPHNESLTLVPYRSQYVAHTYWYEDSKNTMDALPLAFDWLKDCILNHPLCKPRAYSVLPARMLYLDKETSHVRLVTTNTLAERIEYATLSHCWGAFEFLKLKLSNLEQFKQEIPIEALSQTFRDSIHILKTLGLSYVWIDSLCIIQDDKDDWQRESQLMASVYGSSTISISADGASDGSKGCFFERNTHQCVVEIGASDPSKPLVCVPSDLYTRCMDSLPLGKRGWALQERLLPSRILHFTPTQVIWECYMNTAFESLPRGFPKLYSRHYPLHELSWNSVIMRFSRCQLTYPTDKFVAISGVARTFQMQTQDQYIAGMWRKDLVGQLCWSCYGEELLSSSEDEQQKWCSQYIAPTWSWMSAYAGVTPRTIFSTGDSVIRVIDVQVTLSSKDIFGPISAGTLQIACDCLLAHSSPVKGGYFEGSPTHIDDMEQDFEISFWFDPLVDRRGSAPSTIYLLPVISNSSEGVLGLILQATGTIVGQYTRLGVFSIPSGNGNEFVSLLGKKNPKLGPHASEYISLDPDESQEFRYIIEII